MAELLSQEEVAVALEALPGWSGSPSRLERTVPVQEIDYEELEQGVAAIGDEMGHHAVTEHAPEGMRLLLWTHVDGGVTARDVELAARLDRLFSGSAGATPGD